MITLKQSAIEALEPWGVQMNNLDYVRPWLKCNSLRKNLVEQGKDGSRSSKATDVLNTEVIRIFKNTLPEEDGWSFSTEERIACSRGDTFTVDVLVYKGKTLRAAILLKSIQKSYNKNRHNYANTLEGEVARIKDLPMHSGVSVIAIDWIPREVPVGDKMEKTKIPDTSPAELRWNQFLKDKSFVSFNKISFDVSGDTAINIEGVKKLQNTIERLKHV